jgi:hypothetical protein
MVKTEKEKMRKDKPADFALRKIKYLQKLNEIE